MSLVRSRGGDQASMWSDLRTAVAGSGAADAGRVLVM